MKGFEWFSHRPEAVDVEQPREAHDRTRFSLSGAPDRENPERPAHGAGDAASDEIDERGGAWPQAAKEPAAGGSGGGGHRLEVGPRGLLDEAVPDADVRSGRGHEGRAGLGGVDRGRRQQVPERGVAGKEDDDDVAAAVVVVVVEVEVEVEVLWSERRASWATAEAELRRRRSGWSWYGGVSGTAP
ncbi:polypyrimidine tract-binding protein 3 [Striga asiatica]|uniref:Polypyrimidine tract-binding protein 3 n=1 Tax=Striga asiatica TaxID=4170 RepID=A0A5A7PLX8_STRAF|nr:polypyrimidine tract-binding protein 3 [Striga asiatica]